MNIKGSQTYNNLVGALVNEAQVKIKYEVYAKIAKKEGLEQISGIFSETSEHEKAHHSRLLKFLNSDQQVEISTIVSTGAREKTENNLLRAIEWEKRESEELYPQFEQIASDEGFKDIAAAFKVIAKAEEFHAKRFQRFLDHLKNGTMFIEEEPVAWICRKCGYVHTGKKPLETCPACLHPKGYFERLRENY